MWKHQKCDINHSFLWCFINVKSLNSLRTPGGGAGRGGAGPARLTPGAPLVTGTGAQRARGWAPPTATGSRPGWATPTCAVPPGVTRWVIQELSGARSYQVVVIRRPREETDQSLTTNMFRPAAASTWTSTPTSASAACLASRMTAVTSTTSSTTSTGSR